MNNNTKTILRTGGGQVELTWMRTEDPEQFKPYFQVYGIVFNDAGEILLIQEAGKWKIPGGTPEGEETAIDTLKRELVEEADVEVLQVLPLGAQRVEYPNNPSKKEGDLFYQYRYVCLADKLLERTPDPDNGIIHPRMFVPAEKVTEYVQWGNSGNSMFADAIQLFNEKIKNHISAS
jgi:8-oxo-dGTP pyrophosphatase MutT (NUDIX family)